MYALIILLSAVVFSQEISISASVNKNVAAVGEQINLKLTISGNISALSRPKLPPINGIDIYESGTSQSISIVNNQISASFVYNYVLVPRKEGEYVIPPISIDFKGKRYQTEPIKIKVTSRKVSPRRFIPKEMRAPIAKLKDIFITASVDKKTAFVDEQITYSFKFYRRIRLLSQPKYIPPKMIGFRTEDLPPQREYNVRLDGRLYHVIEVKTALFGTSAGEYEIEPAKLECEIEDFSPFDIFSDDFFTKFFSHGRKILLKTKPIRVKILALPSEGKPLDFSGAVGKYKIRSSIDKKELRVNEPLLLTVSIEGSGNIKSIPQPKIIGLENFKRYRTISSLNISKKNYKISGSKVFKINLVPKIPGEQQIPKINFCFFDPEIRAYKRVSTNPIPVKVLPPLVVKEEVMPGSVKIVQKDIRYIKLSDKLLPEGKELYENTFFIVIQVLPLLVLVGCWRYKSHLERMNRDIGYARWRSAYWNFCKKRKAVLDLLRKGDSKKFYSELFNAFLVYISDKLNMPSAGLSMENLEAILRERRIDDITIKRIKMIWEEADFIRFGLKAATKEEMEKIYKEVLNLTSEVEKKFRSSNM